MMTAIAELAPSSTGLDRSPSIVAPVLICCMGIFSANATASQPMPALETPSATTAFDHPAPEPSHQESEAPLSPQECVREIRKISNVTWKEIAEIFGVSQRTMHSWSNGENVKSGNEALIREVLAKLRKIHDGNSKATAYRLRSLHGDKPLLSVIRDIPLSELAPTAVPSHVTRPSRTDGTRLMANWDPTPPFRDRWDREPITEEIKPVGEYPIKLPKIAPKWKV